MSVLAMHARGCNQNEGWAGLIGQVTEQFATPCYIARWRPVDSAVVHLESMTDAAAALRCWFSFKTHPLPPLVRRWLASGRGVEVVSETEFVTAINLGASVDDLLVNGVAKHAWLPRHPLQDLQVHFDSLTEVAALLPVAVQSNWRLGIRCHVPGECDARDRRFGGQFGMTPAEAVEALDRLRDAGADVRGVHFHIGQRPQGAAPYQAGVEHVAKVCAAARFSPRYVDLGGGLPPPGAADDAIEDLQRAIGLARQVFSPTLKSVWLENGRYVTEASTVLAVRVLDIKQRDDSRYLICDGGRTNQALAADHGLHPLLLIPERQGPLTATTICGPTCMTDDVLARLPLPADIARGDVIAWLNAGAYHLPWETRFSQGLCAVVWCDEGAGEVTLARRPEPPEVWSQAWTISTN